MHDMNIIKDGTIPAIKYSTMDGNEIFIPSFKVIMNAKGYCYFAPKPRNEHSVNCRCQPFQKINVSVEVAAKIVAIAKLTDKLTDTRWRVLEDFRIIDQDMKTLNVEQKKVLEQMKAFMDTTNKTEPTKNLRSAL